MRALATDGPWPTRALLVAAAVFLFFFGQALRPAPTRPSPARVLAAGPLKVAYGPDWWPARPAKGPARWRGISGVDGSQAEVGVLPQGPAFAAPLRALFGGALPIPARVRIGQLPALAYRSDSALAYVFAAAGGGRVGLACSFTASDSACSDLASRADVTGAIDGDARPAAAAGLRTALAAVETAWPPALRQLRTQQAATRVAAANRMATAYADLGRRAAMLRQPQVAAAARDVAATLTALAGTTAGRPGEQQGLGRRVLRAQARLRSAVAALRAQGFEIVGSV